MATFVKCDVKGCDTIAQVEHEHALPRDWWEARFEVTDPAERERAIAHHRRSGLASVPGAVLGVARTVRACPKHPLPAFDPEFLGDEPDGG